MGGTSPRVSCSAPWAADEGVGEIGAAGEGDLIFAATLHPEDVGADASEADILSGSRTKAERALGGGDRPRETEFHAVAGGARGFDQPLRVARIGDHHAHH